jgi:hypothetical protein
MWRSTLRYQAYYGIFLEVMRSLRQCRRCADCHSKGSHQNTSQLLRQPLCPILYEVFQRVLHYSRLEQVTSHDSNEFAEAYSDLSHISYVVSNMTKFGYSTRNLLSYFKPLLFFRECVVFYII